MAARADTSEPCYQQTLPASKDDGWLMRQRDWALLAMVISGYMPRTEKEVIAQVLSGGSVMKNLLDIVYDAAAMFIDQNKGVMYNEQDSDSGDSAEEPQENLPLCLRSSSVMKLTRKQQANGMYTLEFEAADSEEEQTFYDSIEEVKPAAGRRHAGIFQSDEEKEAFKKMLRENNPEFEQ